MEQEEEGSRVYTDMVKLQSRGVESTWGFVDDSRNTQEGGSKSSRIVWKAVTN
jgi:hypothetical protein